MRITLAVFLFIFSLDAFALVNGAPLEGAADAVRIWLTNGWVCSGVFVDPYTILTAAHCVSKEKDVENLQMDKIESEGDSILNVEVLRFIPHPGYSGQAWPAYDIGIIKTTKNPQFEGRFQLQKEDQGYLQEAVLIGSGRTEHETKKYSRTTGENRVVKMGAVLFFVGESVAGKGKIGINVSAAPNDSGGPIIEKASGRIVGVITRTTLKDSIRYGLPTLSMGTSTSNDRNRAFIEGHLGKLSNEP